MATLARVCIVCVSACENPPIHSTGCAICSSLIKLMCVCQRMCTRGNAEFPLNVPLDKSTSRLQYTSKEQKKKKRAHGPTHTHTHTAEMVHLGCYWPIFIAHMHIMKMNTLPSGCCSGKSSIHLKWEKCLITIMKPTESEEMLLIQDKEARNP